jgi:hypothetical protein
MVNQLNPPPALIESIHQLLQRFHVGARRGWRGCGFVWSSLPCWVELYGCWLRSLWRLGHRLILGTGMVLFLLYGFRTVFFINCPTLLSLNQSIVLLCSK